MRVRVDYEKCNVNAYCARIAPEVFDIDDETETLKILQEEPAAELREKVREAVESCPTQALSLAEE